MHTSKKNDQVQVLIGTQWGDEGKGRVVDFMASGSDLVIRYQGGANAGHTVIANGKKHVFHLLPSGMLFPDRVCVIGNGVVVDPEQLLKEISELDQPPEAIGTKLVLSEAAHIVMPYHKLFDGLSERSMQKSASGVVIGTTGRGIGPCYVDKANRIGIRAGDLVAPALLEKKLRLNIEMKNALLEKVYGEKPLDFDEIYSTALKWGESLSKYLGDSGAIIDEAYRAGKSILFEGAQATLLDIDHGTYPFVTSSNCSAGGACTGGPIGPDRIGRVIGVVKAYCTRVGEGPFPSEDHGADGERLRAGGAEFGATTGRPRRCGWLDLVAVNYTVLLNGIGVIALTKLDVLSGFDEIKVCTEYEIDGARTPRFPSSTDRLERAKPIYTTLPGWSEDITKCRTFDELPQNAKEYVRYIERATGVYVGLIGVGPDREDTIINDF